MRVGFFPTDFYDSKKTQTEDHRRLLLEDLDMRCVLISVLAVKNVNSMCIEVFR